MNTENLSALFENGAYTLVVQKNGVTVHKDFGRGVGPALRVFDAQPELLKGALVCDTIVGKGCRRDLSSGRRVGRLCRDHERRSGGLSDRERRGLRL